MASEARIDEWPQIRRCRNEDLPALRAILAATPETVSWLPGGESIGTTVGGTILLVSESQEHVDGLVMGRQAADEAEILNIAVQFGKRRSGVGTALLRAILEVFREQKAGRVFLEVRESNAAAISFYQKHGFRVIGRRAGYYRNPDEAALILEMKLVG
jgi:[ribosomal protein S18]-alanine N-acetyltransferase